MWGVEQRGWVYGGVGRENKSVCTVVYGCTSVGSV